MAYTGRWRSTRTYVDRAAALGHPEYGTLHMHTDWTEPGSRPPYAAPRVDAGPDTIRDQGTAYDLVTSRRAPGRPLDHSPESHQGDAAPGGYLGSLPSESRRRGNNARSIDQGASLRQIWKAPRFRQSDDRRETVVLEVLPTSNGSHLGALRGRNSLPENNPDGFRIGRRVQRWMNRKIPTVWRRPDLRPLRVHLAATAVSSGPPEDGSRYTSPFNSTISARRRTVSASTERRSPRPWDQDYVNDGVTEDAEPDSSFTVWGL